MYSIWRNIPINLVVLNLFCVCSVTAGGFICVSREMSNSVPVVYCIFLSVVSVDMMMQPL